jgi:hypothetical protein
MRPHSVPKHDFFAERQISGRSRWAFRTFEIDSINTSRLGGWNEDCFDWLWQHGRGAWVELPILDGDGYPIQKRGVTNYPGLYFVGLPWLHNAKSGLLYGVGGDAAYISLRITTDDRLSSAADMEDVPEESWLSHDLCCA